MKNELVIIDAGHSGIDSGAEGNGLEEKDSYDYILRTYKNIEQN